MTERDKLIKLIENSYCVDIWDHYNDDFKEPNPIEVLADQILADGWTKPICKPGDTVYVIRQNNCGADVVSEGIVVAIEYAIGVDTMVKVKRDGNYGSTTMWYSLSKVFADKKEAEKVAFKLREYDNGCLVCSSDYNQEIISTLIRYHTSEATSGIIETRFCPNCGRRLCD